MVTVGAGSEWKLEGMQPGMGFRELDRRFRLQDMVPMHMPPERRYVLERTRPLPKVAQEEFEARGIDGLQMVFRDERLIEVRVEYAGRTGEFEIDSAGTHGYHVGHPPDSRMLAAARARGYLLDSRARRLERGDFENFDLIVTMDDANLADAQALCPGGPAQLVRMVDYCERIAVDEVPDPYYGGPAGFERVLDILEDACGNLLRQF